MTTVNVTDREGALAACDFHQAALSELKGVLTDGGYTGQPFDNAVNELLGATVKVVKRNALPTVAVIPKCWLDKSHRLYKNGRRKLNKSLKFINLAFLAVLLRRL